MSSSLKLTVKRQKTGGYAAVDAAAAASASAAAPTIAPSSSSTSPSPSSPPSAPPGPSSGGKRRFKSILDYLCSLSSHTLTQLYRDPFTVLTIFRSLPPLAKQYALRLVCIAGDGSGGQSEGGLRVEKGLLDGWCRSELISQQAHHAALMRLQELHIFIKSNAKTAASDAPLPTFRLSHTFAAQLQRAITNQIPDLSAESSSSGPSLSAEELTSYAANRWNQLLHFMVGVRTLGSPSPAVQSHLQLMSLMLPAADGKTLLITPAGFSFLFKDQHTQVWDIVLAYIGGVKAAAAAEREELLTFLFHLAFMRVGKEYPRSKLTRAQSRMVDDLSGFGLILGTAAAFHPTHLVYNLSSSSSAGLSSLPAASSASSPLGGPLSSSSSGYIIVETTFKVYAYTSSPFQLSLLNLFLRFDYHLPNLLVATITKASVRRALLNNITAQEIIHYLEQYAHHCMKTAASGSSGILPENVVDAMRLWEAERSRMEVTDDVCLLTEFEAKGDGRGGQDEYAAVLDELRRHDAVVYYNDSKRTIVTTEAGVAVVRALRQAQAASRT